MDIFVYSDESGVFDKTHNEFYTYGGVVFLSKEDKDTTQRKYLHAERLLRQSNTIDRSVEIKAATSSTKDKYRLYRSLNQVIKFGVIVHQPSLRDRIFGDKKTKQRYLDYAFKRGIKYCFQALIQQGQISPEDVNNIYFYADEHSTATNGRYELRESLEQEFKLGIHNFDWNVFYSPLFPGMHGIHMNFCDSSSVTLIRAADIVANYVYHLAIEGKPHNEAQSNLFILNLP